MKKRLEEFVHKNKSEFNENFPESVLFDRILEKMNEPKNCEKKKLVQLGIRNALLAVASLILVAGSVVFYFINISEKKIAFENKIQHTLPANQFNIKSEPAPKTDTIKKVALNNDNNSTPHSYFRNKYKGSRDLLVLYKTSSSNASASSRLAQLSKIVEAKVPEKELIDLLVKTMNEDPNTNVRMASLEALSKFCGEKYVKRKMINSLSRQKDPIVQIALIRLLTQMREHSIIKELEVLTEDINTMDAVKDNAFEGLLKLKM